MRCSIWNYLVLSTTLAAAAAGCSWKSPFGGAGSSPFGKDEKAVPTAPNQSQLTHAPSPLAPKPSVTIPQASPPTGTAGQAESNTFLARFRQFGTSTREALTFTPRETPPADPTQLGGTPKDVAAPVYVSAARVYEAQGKNDEATVHYKKALAAEPNNLDALLGYARLKHRQSDIEGAVQLYNQALKAHPNSAIAYNDLGLCLAKRGQLPEASDALTRAVTLDPQSKLYRNNLALVLIETGRIEDAQKQLMAVHSEPIAHYNLAYLLLEKGRKDEARQHLYRALQLEPSLEPARLLIARIDGATQSATQYAQTAVQTAAPVYNAFQANQYAGPSPNGQNYNVAPENNAAGPNLGPDAQNNASASRWNETSPAAPPAVNPFYQ